MKKSLIILSIFATLSLSGKVITFDNINDTAHINLSKSDTNRLVFPSDIKYQASSKEKDLTITTVGKEMYLKFIPYVTQEQVAVGDKVSSSGEAKLNYDNGIVNEIFVVTNGKTYSIIVHPVQQEATTVIFTETLDDKKKKIEAQMNNDSEYVTQLTTELILPILRGEEPSSYEVLQSSSYERTIRLKNINTDMKLKQTKLFKGYKYDIEEYKIDNPNKFVIAITDAKELLQNIISAKDSVLAYSIYYGNRTYKIFPNQSAKLVVVKKARLEDGR